MTTLGNEAGGKGPLWGRSTGWRSGGRDRGKHPCHSRPLGGTSTGGGLGFLLIEALNAFNEENRTDML